MNVTGNTVSNATFDDIMVLDDHGTNNFIGYNTLTNSTGNGIYMYGSTNIPIYGNMVASTSQGASGGGILIDSSSSIQIGNPVAGNGNTVSGFAAGIGLFYDNRNVVTDSNNIGNNAIGIAAMDETLDGHNNIILNNRIAGNGTGIQLDYANNALIYRNTLTNDGTGIYALDGSHGTLVGSTSIDGGGSGTGVQLDGAGTSLQFSDQGNSFSHLSRYFILQNGAMAGQTLDASHQTFDGVVAYNFTYPQWAAAENLTVDRHNGQSAGTVYYASFPPAQP